MAAWLDTGRDFARIVRRARGLGVSVTSEQLCCVPPSYPGCHLHLSFAHMNEEEITRGLELLIEAIHEVSGMLETNQ